MTTTAAAPKSSSRANVQKFGTFLSNMVMPNIGAFIAWGLITALFIEKGWFPVAQLGGFGTHIVDGKEVAWTGLVGPMITYLLPLLIAYTGGKMVYDVRGGVVGAIATMGVIVGTSIPMFMGAMMMGPLGGWTIKKLDGLWHEKIKPGFEMLVNNFSAGIWGGMLAVFGYYVMGPIVSAISAFFGWVVGGLVATGLLPLTSILIEPAKVLFLNNAINHGILTPLGTQQSIETGKSILFLLEANPGPGLGLLLAYMFFGKGAAKASASGAAIIHFFGGIHEIYFPYVLAKPVLVLATIAGGATGILTNQVLGGGLIAPAAPGSIIAVLAQTERNSYVAVILSVILAATVSFLVAMVLLRLSKDEDDGDLSKATADMEAMKGKKSSVASSLVGAGPAGAVHTGPIKNIVFACDAGMGSSAMGASVLRRKIQAAGFGDVSVVNKAISNLTDTFDLVVSHQDLTERAKQGTPSALHVSVDNFMASPRYEEVVELIRAANSDAPTPAPAPVPAAPATAQSGSATMVGSAPAAVAVAERPAAETSGSVLKLSSIVLAGSATDRNGAITEAGNLLVASGNVDAAYVASMHDRERSVSTYMGNLLAIPHGTNEAKSMISSSSISVVRYPDGIDWNGNPVKFVIGIAGAGNDHLELLGKIAEVFLDESKIAELEAATSAQQVRDSFGKVNA